MAVLQGGLSRHQAAARFGLAIGTVSNWVRRFQQTGAVVPGQMGGHRPRRIGGEHEAWLTDRLRKGDFTLPGLVLELAERGLEADYQSVWAFARWRGLTHKKRNWSPPGRAVPTLGGGASSGLGIGD